MFSVDSMVDEIDRLSQRMIGDIERRDRRLSAPLDLTPSQAHTLQALEELGETAMSRLSNTMGVHGTTMTRMVDTLVERGLVDRVPDSRDRRVVQVMLNPQGRAVVGALRRSRRDLMEATLRRVPEPELLGMLEGLRYLALLAKEWGAGKSSDGREVPSFPSP